MSRRPHAALTATGRRARTEGEEAAGATRDESFDASHAVPGAPPSEPALETAGIAAVRLISLGSESARVAFSGRDVDAAIEPAVDRRVLETALRRGERVIVQREGAGWVVLGTLRTAPTPGVDEGDFVIRAGRLRVVVDHAFEVVGGTASLILRASGRVETFAEEITARATGVQRLVARMLRLN
jgi:hypothetical protein